VRGALLRCVVRIMFRVMGYRELLLGDGISAVVYGTKPCCFEG